MGPVLNARVPTIFRRFERFQNLQVPRCSKTSLTRERMAEGMDAVG